METWLTKREIHKGKIFTLLGGKVTLDDGKTSIREIVHHPGGVAVVPVVEDNVILIRQFRIAIGRELIELPAGLLEPGEDPLGAAERELEEEIGYRAKELIPLASYYSSVGFADERMHIFLALNPAKARHNREVEERMCEVSMPLEVVRAKLTAREFEDAKTIIGLREFFTYMERIHGK